MYFRSSYLWINHYSGYCRFFHKVILSMILVLLCRKMAHSLTIAQLIKNSVVRWKPPNPLTAHVITKTFIMVKNIVDAQNTLRFQMTCIFLLTETVHTLKGIILFAQSVSVANLNTLTHISLLAVAVTTINTKSSSSYHKLKAVKQIA